MSHPRDYEYPTQEADRRRDDAIRRALNTPPKPHKEMVGKTKSPPSRGKKRDVHTSRSP